MAALLRRNQQIIGFIDASRLTQLHDSESSFIVSLFIVSPVTTFFDLLCKCTVVSNHTFMECNYVRSCIPFH